LLDFNALEDTGKGVPNKPKGRERSDSAPLPMCGGKRLHPVKPRQGFAVLLLITVHGTNRRLMTNDTVESPAGRDPECQNDQLRCKSAPYNWLRCAVLAWIIAIVIFHLGSAAAGKSIYRDIHLGTALQYAKGPIHLLKPVIVGFNLNAAPTPQEFPLWQGVAGLAMKLLGLWFGWANAVSLLFFFSCLYPLFKLAERSSGTECAWWTLLLFLAQPLIFLFAGEASPDGMALAATVWFFFFATKLWDEPTLTSFCLTILSGALAAVSKLPFFMAAGLGCAFTTLAVHRRRKAAWVWLGTAALVIGTVFLVWNKYVNRCYAEAEMPFVDLRHSSPEMNFWFFGDLAYRLSPGVWVKGAWRALTALFGSFALAGLLGCALVLRSSDKLGKWWLAGAAVTTLIFFHLVLHHTHYYLMFAPAVALFCAPVAARLESGLGAAMEGKRLARRAIVLGTLALSTGQGLAAGHAILYFDKYPQAMATLIREHTRESDRLLIQGGGWGGELLFLSDRKGLSIWNTKPLEDPLTLARLKALGFDKLVLVSESPLLSAIQHSTSARPSTDRKSYVSAATPIIDRWRTILQTDDILIKELP
jgi:hypothetical protein